MFESLQEENLHYRSKGRRVCVLLPFPTSKGAPDKIGSSLVNWERSQNFPEQIIAVKMLNWNKE